MLDMKDLKELEKKKKNKGPMDENEAKAKMSILKDIHGIASKAAGDEMKGSLKKVTVASPDEEGLKMGLDKAKELVAGKDMPPGADESDDESTEDSYEEAAESPKDEAAEEGEEDGKPSAEKMIADEVDHEAAEGDLSDEEIEELIELLQSKKASKQK